MCYILGCYIVFGFVLYNYLVVLVNSWFVVEGEWYYFVSFGGDVKGVKLEGIFFNFYCEVVGFWEGGGLRIFSDCFEIFEYGQVMFWECVYELIGVGFDCELDFFRFFWV